MRFIESAHASRQLLYPLATLFTYNYFTTQRLKKIIIPRLKFMIY